MPAAPALRTGQCLLLLTHSPACLPARLPARLALQVFQQVTRLLQMLSVARVPKASSGLELLLRQHHQRQLQQAAAAQPPGADPVAAAAAAAPAGPPGAEAAQAEVAAAWECMQVECQRLLACLLDAPAPTQQAQRGDEAAGDVPLAGWLASVGSELEAASPAASATEAGTLSFSLEHEVGGLLARSPDAAGGGGGDGGGAGGGGDGGDLRDRIRAILGGHPGGPALVASLYRPVLAFAEAAERHVSGLAGAGAEPGGRMAALLSMPWRGGAEVAPAERCLLRSYTESFLRMEFLPAVYVSAR